MPDDTTATTVERLLEGIEGGAVPEGLFADDAVLDATVPNWRFSVRGAPAIRDELARWYADPGQFLDVRRTALPEGELVEFTLSWNEQGIAHRCHQAHILEVREGRISADTAFCGGRWPAPLVAEMEAAGG